MKHDCNGQRAFSPEEISQITTAYRASGLSLAQFAQERGIREGRLHYWLYDRAKGGAVRQRAKGPSAAPLFRELSVSAGLPGMGSWGAEVSLPGGVSVRFSAGSAPSWIGSVVQKLQEPC